MPVTVIHVIKRCGEHFKQGKQGCTHVFYPFTNLFSAISSMDLCVLAAD